jgi:WD40 repeat protein
MNLQIFIDITSARVKKQPFNKSILNGTNMEFYCDEFSLIITDSGAEIRSLDTMSLINLLLPYRTSGRTYFQSLLDFSYYLWYREYQLDLNRFSSAIMWDVDYDQLKIAFAHVTSSVRYYEFKIFIKSIVSPDGKLRVEVGQNSENLETVFIYLTEDDTLYREFIVYTRVYDWAFSPDSNIIYISGSVEKYDYPEWIRVFNISENRLLTLVEYKAVIKRDLSTQNLLAIPIDVSPDGRYLATGNELGQIHGL